MNISNSFLILVLIFLVQALIPESPFADGNKICPEKDGDIINVNGFIGTPFKFTIFQDLYQQPLIMQSKGKSCRDDSHCVLAYEIDITQAQLKKFDNIISACASKPGAYYITVNGESPGRTIRVQEGTETLVRVNNKINNIYYHPSRLCTENNKTGRAISVHLHGSSSLSPFDGWADDLICGNQTKDYVYPNNMRKMLWYHDHGITETASNVNAGMFGVYQIMSKCQEPYNLKDIEKMILVVSDNVLDSECQPFFDQLNIHSDDRMGDINTINGIPFPLMELDPKWYRFPLLNAAPSRTFKILIKDENQETVSQQMCYVVATDGGFRPNAVKFPSEGLLIGPSERYEIVCDFSDFKGKTLYLWNDKVLDLPYFCYSHLIAKITVSQKNIQNSPQFNHDLAPDQSKSPLNIILSKADIKKAKEMVEKGQFHQEINFLRHQPTRQWRINGESWNTAKILQSSIGHNTWQVWKFTTGGEGEHIVHMHLVDLFLLKREGDQVFIEDYEAESPKDSFFLGPNTSVFVLMRFGAHKGDYMFHCHNLVHEDSLMIRAFRVMEHNSSANNFRFIADPLTRIVYGDYQYASPMISQLVARPTSSVETLERTLVKVRDTNFYAIFYPVNQQLIYLSGFINPWTPKKC